TAIVALQIQSSASEHVARQLASDLSVVQRLRYAAERVVASSHAYLVTGEAQYEERFEETLADLRSELRALRSRPLDLLVVERAREVERTATEYIDTAEIAARQRTLGVDPRQQIPDFDKMLRQKREAFESSVDELANHEHRVLEAWLDDAEDV